MNARYGRQGRARGRGTGFTLIELLVVMAVITMLAGISLPVSFGIWKHGRETSCRNNLRQIGTGLFMYANSWDRYFPANRQYKGATRPRGYDDLSPLFGVDAWVKDKDGKNKKVSTTCFVPDLRVFNCPSTRDVASTPMELRFKRTEPVPDGAPADVPRKQQLSYEYCGEYNPSLQYARTSPRVAWLCHDEDAVAEVAGGASLFEEALGPGNGTNQLSGTLANPPVVAGTVKFSIMSQYGGFTFQDDGSGGFVGQWPLTATGTIDYATGQFSVTFNTPISNFYEITVKYEQQGDKVALALNKFSNHRLRGGNMLFLDGRVEWVSAMGWPGQVLGGMDEWTRVTGWKD